jgi:hypothetical protein
VKDYGNGIRYNQAVKKKIKTSSIAKAKRLKVEKERIHDRDIVKWDSILLDLAGIENETERQKEASLIFTQWKFSILT